jgi:hypothetical protein
MGNQQSHDIPISNPRNNHDHEKVRHATRKKAEFVRQKMIQKKKPGSERLNTYYNEDDKGYYNGKSSKRCYNTNRDRGNYSSGGESSSGDAGIMLLGLAAYGIYCAGKWAVEQLNGNADGATVNGNEKEGGGNKTEERSSSPDYVKSQGEEFTDDKSSLEAVVGEVNQTSK